MLALVIFWLSIFSIFYTYAGFIILLYLLAKLFPKPYKEEDITPDVTVVIAAYNEENYIEERIKNLQAQNYPQDKMKILIANDGSKDSTAEIVGRYVNEQVTLVDLPNGGKDIALNKTVPQATGEILVFSDANTHFDENVIRKLVRPFADPKVGGVAGDQRYLKADAKDSNAGERVYWNFDRFLKELQSTSGNVISGTGAIYAIRRELFEDVPAGVMDDFYISTSIIAQGYRLVFEGDAAAYEPVTASSKSEFNRKRRNVMRGLYAVWANRRLLNPFKHGFYSLQVFTHKVLRRVLFIPLFLIFISNIFLWNAGIFYQLTMALQVLFYFSAIVGWFLEERGIRLPKIFSLPYFVCLVYWAAFLATWDIIRGKQIKGWTTARQEMAQDQGSSSS